MDPEPDVPLTMSQRCIEKFDKFVVAGVRETLETKPVSLMLEYWRSEWKYPNMARAAGALLFRTSFISRAGARLQRGRTAHHRLTEPHG